VLAPDGRVVGIMVASSPRRGIIATVDTRHATSPAGTVTAGVRPLRGTGRPIRPAEVDRVNEHLQAEGTIGRVVCRT
jgi:hypothetical protein